MQNQKAMQPQCKPDCGPTAIDGNPRPVGSPQSRNATRNVASPTTAMQPSHPTGTATQTRMKPAGKHNAMRSTEAAISIRIHKQ